jgi:hypothetical protein
MAAQLNEVMAAARISGVAVVASRQPRQRLPAVRLQEEETMKPTAAATVMV